MGLGCLVPVGSVDRRDEGEVAISESRLRIKPGSQRTAYVARPKGVSRDSVGTSSRPLVGWWGRGVSTMPGETLQAQDKKIILAQHQERGIAGIEQKGSWRRAATRGLKDGRSRKNKLECSTTKREAADRCMRCAREKFGLLPTNQACTVPPQPTHQKIYVETQDVIPTAPGHAPPKLEAGSNKQQKLLSLLLSRWPGRLGKTRSGAQRCHPQRAKVGTLPVLAAFDWALGMLLGSVCLGFEAVNAALLHPAATTSLRLQLWHQPEAERRDAGFSTIRHPGNG